MANPKFFYDSIPLRGIQGCFETLVLWADKTDRCLCLIKSSKPHENISLAWTKKQRRCYGRILNCIKFARARHEQLYFLTLTSVKDTNNIERAYDRLVKRLRYHYTNYEYVRVRTNEGVNGVLHILFRGRRLYVPFVRSIWQYLSGGARQIRLLKCYGNTKRLCNYLCRYMASQNSFMSMSQNMLWKGWAKTFRYYIIDEGYQKGIAKWELLLATLAEKRSFKISYEKLLLVQTCLDSFGEINNETLEHTAKYVSLGLAGESPLFLHVDSSD